jgi:hypothetical protein
MLLGKKKRKNYEPMKIEHAKKAKLPFRTRATNFIKGSVIGKAALLALMFSGVGVTGAVIGGLLTSTLAEKGLNKKSKENQKKAEYQRKGLPAPI